MTACKYCNKEIEINHRLDAKKVFCNRSCSTSFNNRKRMVTDEQKQKSRESLFKTLATKGWVKKENKQKHISKPCTRCGSMTKNEHNLCHKCARKPYHCKRCGIPSSTEYCLDCLRLNNAELVNAKIETGRYTSTNTHRLKQYIINDRGHRCEICNQTEWMGQPIPLVLDHINGRSSENKLDNLRLVCGNCDMQLPTYKSKNKNSDRKARKGAY